MTENLSHRAQLAREIEDALRASSRPLSSAELTGMCHSAQDSTDIGRVIYYLRDQGIVTQADLVKAPGRSPTKTWMLMGAADADIDPAQVPVHVDAMTDAVAADIDSDIAKLADYLAADVAASPTLREILAEQDSVPAPPVTVLPGTYSHDRPSAAGHSADIPVTPEEDEFCAHCMARLASARPGEKCDQTELDLADLVDQADESLLALADYFLDGNPAWAAARKLSEDTFNAMFRYRARAAMSDDRTEPAPPEPAASAAPVMRIEITKNGSKDSAWLHIDAPSGLQASVHIGDRSPKTIVGMALAEVAEFQAAKNPGHTETNP